MLEILSSFEYLPTICPGPDASRQILLLTCRRYELSDSSSSLCDMILPLYLVILEPGWIVLVTKRPNPDPVIEDGRTSQLSRSPDALSEFSSSKIDGSSGVVGVGGVVDVVVEVLSRTAGTLGVTGITWVWGVIVETLISSI